MSEKEHFPWRYENRYREATIPGNRFRLDRSALREAWGRGNEEPREQLAMR